MTHVCCKEGQVFLAKSNTCVIYSSSAQPDRRKRHTWCGENFFSGRRGNSSSFSHGLRTAKVVVDSKRTSGKRKNRMAPYARVLGLLLLQLVVTCSGGWGPCPWQSSVSGVQCANVSVPLDWNNLGAGNISVFVSVVPSTAAQVPAPPPPKNLVLSKLQEDRDRLVSQWWFGRGWSLLRRTLTTLGELLQQLGL